MIKKMYGKMKESTIFGLYGRIGRSIKKVVGTWKDVDGADILDIDGNRIQIRWEQRD